MLKDSTGLVIFLILNCDVNNRIVRIEFRKNFVLIKRSCYLLQFFLVIKII